MASQISYLAGTIGDEQVEDDCVAPAPEEKAEVKEVDQKHASLDEEVKEGMAPPICRICVDLGPRPEGFGARASGTA